MSAVAHRKGNMALLTIALLLAKSTWFSAAAILPVLRSRWDLSATASAWLSIVVALGFVTGALASALWNLADRLTPQRLILLGSLGAALANLFVLTSPGWALVSRAVTGMCIAAIYPPALKLVATWYPPGRGSGRGAALGIAVGALSVGTALPHLINGAGHLEPRLVVWGTSAATVFAGVLVASTVRHGPHPFPAVHMRSSQVGEVVRNRQVRLATYGYVCHMWELYAMWAWFASFIAAVLQQHGREPWPLAAYVTFVVISAGGVGNWAGGVLGDRIGRERAAAAMLAVSGGCAALIGPLSSAPLAIIIVIGVIWGFTVVGDSAQFSALVTERAPQHLVGTALTMQMAAGFTITTITIWLIPAAVTLVGWTWAFLVLVPGPALGILAMRASAKGPADPR